MATKTPKFKTTANPAYAQGMREIRSSNKAGSHDNRPHRERTRLASKARAIREF